MDQSELFAAIGEIGDNAENLRLLVEQIETPIGVIPFIGAGISIPFGFPSWSTFLINQAKKAGIESKIQRWLDIGEFEEAAEDLLKERGFRAFHDAISSEYGVHKLVGHELYGAAMTLPQLTAGPVITTNFDHVLEEAFKRQNRRFEQEVWGAKASLATRALYQNRRFLLKIHGDAEDSSDRILTRSDYEKYYGNADGSDVDFSLPLPALIQQMLLSRPLLFVGCSLMYDRIVVVLEQVSRTYRDIAHYAIVDAPPTTSDFFERSRFLAEHNVRPIWYPHSQHQYVEALLTYLKSHSPKESSKQVWDNGDDVVDFIDSVTGKVVLILGNFRSERTTILDAIREKLRIHDYVPIVIDPSRPVSRTYTHTTVIMAHLSRFIIADLTEWKSAPVELSAIVPHTKVPVQPLIAQGADVPWILSDLQEYPWVLKTRTYSSAEDLAESMLTSIIASAEAKVSERQTLLQQLFSE
jgi:SIR2-like protein